MLPTATPFFRASGTLFAAQMACAAQCVQDCVDAAFGVSEQQVDALKTLFASSTVATRQWMWAGRRAQGWLIPAAYPEQMGQLRLAAPASGAAPAGAAGTALPPSGD